MVCVGSRIEIMSRAIEINYIISDIKSCNSVGTLTITSLLLNPFSKTQTLVNPKMN